MKMYLSSYGLGSDTDELLKMLPENRKLGYIFNALDFTGADEKRKAKQVRRDIDELSRFGFDCFDLDLKEYFGKARQLQTLIDGLGAIWVSGGNVFVLRQAFKLSGFDKILLSLNEKPDFLYGAYSAGVCVLSPSLNGYHLVIDPSDTPFRGLEEALWDGLGVIDYTFLPHFESGHPSSAAMNEVLKYCKEKKLSYKTARDGEVIIYR